MRSEERGSTSDEGFSPRDQNAVARPGVDPGFIWAGLMFVSAAVNEFAALTRSLKTWALSMIRKSVQRFSEKIMLKQ
ncbi:hypothetical protein V1291_004626 [Nitrobacteraceae bacterium AZCC 1564]